MYTVTYRVLKECTQHHFVPVTRHWFPSTKCGQPLTKCIDADLAFCACFSQNSGLFLFVRLGRVEIATRGVGVSVIEGDRGGEERKSFFFCFRFPPPHPLPLIRPNLSAFLELNMAVSTRGLSVQTTLAHPTKMPAMQGSTPRDFTR